jgi:hypothetical protein
MMRVVASILVNGIALLHYLTKRHGGLELLGYEAEPWKVASAENKAGVRIRVAGFDCCV